jgi:hypothetical protein
VNKNIISKENSEDSPPPFLSKWRNIYAAVFLNLAVLVLLFYLFTKVFE